MKLIHRFVQLTLVAGLVPPVQAQTKASVSIRNVHIITSHAQVSKHPVNVLIEGDRIRQIGSQNFPAQRVIEGNGRYLIPGLIDTHVHLRDVPGLIGQENNPEISNINQEALAQIPKSYLYAGFTTVLDLANSAEAIAKWNSQPIAPQAYFCSPVLIPNGYPVANMPKSTRQSQEISRHYLHDKHSLKIVNMAEADQHSPASLVELGKKEGARCIKVFYEKGFAGKKNLPTPSEATVRELVAVAHKHHLPVFLHGNSLESYEFGLATGVDMIVHGLWNASIKTDNQDLITIAKRLINARIAVQPTVQVIYGEQEIFNPNFFKQAGLHHAIPGSLMDWYQSDAGQWMKKSISSHFISATPISAEQLYQRVKADYRPMLDRVKTISTELIRSKPLLVFGSDTPSGPFYTQFPGFNGREEMNRWLDMGISLEDLFKAMTIENARVIGLQSEIGSVEKGKLANLLLLSKNPLEDITAYDSIHLVVLKGIPIQRETLSALHQ